MESRKYLADFGYMPVNMGCTNEPVQNDKFSRMSWGLTEDGILGVLNPPPLFDVYQSQHCEPSISDLWWQHHSEFLGFLEEDIRANEVLEIGGGSGLLADMASERFNSSIPWTIIEPFPPSVVSESAFWIRGWFPSDLPIAEANVLVASHVLEHSLNPQSFLQDCADFLPMGGRLLLSWPDMESMAKRADLNMLNFEHLHFLPLSVVENLLMNVGMQVLEVRNFQEHSLFLRAEKVSHGAINLKRVETPTLTELENLVQEYAEKLHQTVSKMNLSMSQWPGGEIWLFGAHIFSQYLIAAGLQTARISGILDNSRSKQGLRLYGTSLSVSSPDELRGKSGQLILLSAALYEPEILSQLESLQLSNSLVISSNYGTRTLN